MGKHENIVNLLDCIGYTLFQKKVEIQLDGIKNSDKGVFLARKFRPNEFKGKLFETLETTKKILPLKKGVVVYIPKLIQTDFGYNINSSNFFHNFDDKKILKYMSCFQENFQDVNFKPVYDLSEIVDSMKISVLHEDFRIGLRNVELRRFGCGRYKTDLNIDIILNDSLDSEKSRQLIDTINNSINSYENKIDNGTNFVKLDSIKRDLDLYHESNRTYRKGHNDSKRVRAYL